MKVTVKVDHISQIVQLVQISEQIFSDTAEEFAQLSAVVEKFERWKREDASSYNDAYMSLTAPAIFSPYVRLELLKWDPLREDSDFIDMNCPKLQPLVDFLLILGKNLEKRHVSRTETAKLARRLKKMLVKLNDYDHAPAISRTLNLKEAL